jgi:glyceraldehyde 3-phosphate dehydrogenase
MTRIALHGFGRIGRQLLRIGLQRNLFVPASISDIKDAPTLAALFAVDTNYGRWPELVSSGDEQLTIGGREILYVNAIKELPDWDALGVDLVVDCTGRATTRPGAQAHINRGAKYVLISAPSKTLADCDAVLLKGINLESFNPASHRIVSTGSCTTNALGRAHQGVAGKLRDSVWSLFNGAFVYQLPIAYRPAHERSAELLGGW